MLYHPCLKIHLINMHFSFSILMKFTLPSKRFLVEMVEIFYKISLQFLATLLIFQLLEYKSFTYSYLVADPDTKEAILIDPVIETVPRDSKIVKDLGLNLKYASKPTFKSIKTIQSLEQLYYTTV